MGGQGDWRSYRRQRHRIPRCLIALLLPSLLGATTCVTPRPCQILSSGGVAFIRHIVPAGPRQPEGFGFLQRYRVRIVDRIHGIRLGQDVMDAYSHDEFGYDDGSWPFGRYLFVGVTEPRGLALSTCGQPRPVAEAAEAIRYLRDAVRTGRTASLELRVYSIAGSAAGSVGTLEIGRRRLERLTRESEQKIRFEGLNPGAYRISVRLPGHELERESTEFDVPPGACLTEDARLVPTNYIRGVVVDAGGRPASGVPVSLRFDRHDDTYVDGLERCAPAAFASPGDPAGRERRRD